MLALLAIVQKILLSVSTNHPAVQRTQSLDDLGVFRTTSQVAGDDKGVDLVFLGVIQCCLQRR
jgi:hypothetical protein